MIGYLGNLGLEEASAMTAVRTARHMAYNLGSNADSSVHSIGGESDEQHSSLWDSHLPARITAINVCGTDAKTPFWQPE
jgi:hypothetical protein